MQSLQLQSVLPQLNELSTSISAGQQQHLETLIFFFLEGTASGLSFGGLPLNGLPLTAAWGVEG